MTSSHLKETALNANWTAFKLCEDARLLMPRPSALVEITNRCHLQCQHCFTSANTSQICREADFEGFRRLFKLLHLLGVSRVTISGGEPTLRKDWRELLKLGVDLGFEIHLFTTGLNVSKQDLPLLKDYCTTVCVSLDYPTDHHVMLRKNQRTYINAIKFLDMLESASLQIYVQTMITPGNIGLLPEIVEGLETRGIEMFALTHVSPQGQARHAPYNLFLSQSEKNHLLRFVISQRARFRHVSTNLRSCEELLLQEAVYTRPYLHCLSDGSILPWFGVPNRARIADFRKSDFLAKLSPNSNRVALLKMLDVLQCTYYKAVRSYQGWAIPMDDLIFDAFNENI